RRCEVGMAVAIEVGDEHRVGLARADGVGDLGGKGSVAVVEQHAVGGRAVVGHSQVGVVVPVEVTDGDAVWGGAHGVVDGGGEGAVPGAHEDRDVARAAVGGDDVQATVTG